MAVTKPFEISKQTVWDAYLDVKRSRGGPGIDGQTMEDFERELKDNLYKIWNRMTSGTYFPPPVRQVEIPKSNGGKRMLGIPTVGDRIAQAVVKRHLEPIVEPKFHHDSYGYRPGRSAIDAIAQARQRCWRDDWVLDLDIKGFFDTLDHDLVLRAVRRFTDCRWILLYVERWLKADVQLIDGRKHKRTIGTPQGGVISPLLSNMFLYLAFDKWMLEKYPCIHFERYADDIVVHCRSEKQAEFIKKMIEHRLGLCKLQLNNEKTHIIYCKDSSRGENHKKICFDFLGYTFRPRSVRDKNGRFFVSFSPAISNKSAKAIRQTVRKEWRLKRRTFLSINELAKFLNPMISGWINYYGSFGKSSLYAIFFHINTAIVGWVLRKFKSLRGRKTRAYCWLKNVARRNIDLFAHWRFGFVKVD
jgi:RNA-directed DNA polymerase